MSQDMSQGQKPSTPLPTREGKGEGLFYNGIPYADIIAKYWELFNDGKEPVEGDRNALTFELAMTLRSICGYSLEKMMQVVPNYWAKKCTEGSVPLCTKPKGCRIRRKCICAHANF